MTSKLSRGTCSFFSTGVAHRPARRTGWIAAAAPKVSVSALFCLAFFPTEAGAQNFFRPVPGVYRGSSQCTFCHLQEGPPTTHSKTIQGQEGILTTKIDGQTVSIFDPRTPGYDKFIKPFESYFNIANVIYTVGGHGFMQRFVTRIVPVNGDATAPRESSILALNDTVLMGIQWNEKKGSWEDYHGPTGDNTWTSNSFNTRCGTCHTTGFRAKDYSRVDRWVDIGITCEACHGPSSEINPINLEAKQANEICGSCHTRGVSTTDNFLFPWNENRGGTFKPKEDLDSFIHQVSGPGDHFWPDGESKSHHQQWPDLQLGRHGSAGVRCTDCHHPHKNHHRGQLRDEPLPLCLSCHSTPLINSSDRFEHSRHTDNQATCIDCHMPRTASAVNASDIRSHTFLIIEPQKTREFGIMSGCVDCHTNGPGARKSHAELEKAFKEIAPNFRETALVPAPPDSSRWTGFALANLGQRAARLFFTLFDPDGRIFRAPGVTNPRLVKLEPGRQLASLVDEFFAGGLGGSRGWVRLSHYQPAVKGFYLEGDDAGSELTGLSSDGRSSRSWVTPILWPGTGNRVTLTNLGAADAAVTVTPKNPSGGAGGTPLISSVPARGRRSFDFQPLFPTLPEGGYLEIQSTSELQGQVTVLSGKTLATVRLFEGGSGSNTLTIPHGVAGDGWETRLILYNPVSRPVEIQVEMYRDGAGTGPYGGSSRRTLGPGEMMNESLASFVPASPTRVEGYLLVRTTDPADRIQGAVSFGSVSGGGLAALLAESSGRKDLIFSHVAQGDGYWTGLALLARGGGSALVELHSEQGEILAAQEIKLADRRVATLSQLLPITYARGGYIRVRSESELHAFEIFGNDRASVVAAVPPQ